MRATKEGHRRRERGEKKALRIQRATCAVFVFKNTPKKKQKKVRRTSRRLFA
jgi:hypothetical protein